MPALLPGFMQRLFWPLLTITVLYGCVLVVATHYPRPQEWLPRNAPDDKTLHFTAYGLLGFMAAATLAVSSRWSSATVIKLAVVLALFGVVDEATQPLFGRAADPLDWVYDLAGLCAGIAIAFVMHELVTRLARTPQ